MVHEPDKPYQKALKEMVRADHLIYVSLKYSRTVDVIQSVISRLVDAFTSAMKGALEHSYKGEDLKSALHGPKTMTEYLLKAFPETKEHIDFYNFLRKLNKAPVLERLNEFRRHVTMVTQVDDKKMDIKIETVEDYYRKVNNFINLIGERIEK
ncbi:hypothetical protein GF371_01980 [Candidatus Woesearchaeota archaeon]|nr:hypothetical protein [Candidatus Woesearchaeota archaeon]